MTHLSPAEVVDATDGRLPPARAAHAESCARCGAALASAASTLKAAAEAAADVPEPSPLYWTHQAARIRERVAQETIVPAWRAEPWWSPLRRHGLLPMASAAVLVLAVFTAALVIRDVPGPLRSDSIAVAAPPAPESAMAPENVDVWRVLTSAASDIPLDDAHAAGLSVPSGAVDRAVQRMTPEELNELGRLLQSELRRAGD